MYKNKGFTLIEIIVTIIIIGILTALAVPNYISFLQQGAAKAAQNNLITIYNAQKNYYFSTNSNGSYYQSPGASNDLPSINTALSLNIIDTHFKYGCTVAGTSFTCIATNISDTNLKITVTNNSIILPGGTGCTASPWAVPCNPSCETDVSAYCPN